MAFLASVTDITLRPKCIAFSFFHAGKACPGLTGTKSHSSIIVSYSFILSMSASALSEISLQLESLVWAFPKCRAWEAISKGQSWVVGRIWPMGHTLGTHALVSFSASD